MPVSPQEFARWSTLTGNPYPQTPAERMALAPQVYEFNRNLGRVGGPSMSPARRAVDVVGKAALAAGALAGAAYLGSKYLGGGDDNGGGGGFPASFGKLDLDNEPGIGSTVAEAAPDLNSQVARNSGDITAETTAGNYSQNLNPNQTSAVQEAKGLSSFKPTTSPIEAKPATQSEVISSQQHFSPGTEAEMLGQGAAEKAAAFRKSKAYALMQQRYSTLREPGEELIGGGSEPAAAIETKPTVLTDVNVGEALHNKGYYLAGDPTNPTDLRIYTPGGRELYVSHPYAGSSHRGIQQTALAEQGEARQILESVGVTPEEAHNYWTKKFTPAMEESAVVEMARPATVSRPVATPVTVGGKGPSAEEIREIDTSLARGMARHTPEQRVEIRNQMLAKKYGSAPAPAEVETIVTTTQPVPLRVVSEPAQKSTKVKVNEFLSKMSQGEGPLESYEIPSARSSAVRGINLYPGGEVGVVFPTKQGSKEYAYGATDPMRLAVGDYAAEGFPSEMGHLGKIFGYQGVGPGLGLMRGLAEGGKASTSSAPLYTGLMSGPEISSAMAAPKRTVAARRLAERAANDQETRAIMEQLERRAAERRAMA